MIKNPLSGAAVAVLILGAAVGAGYGHPPDSLALAFDSTGTFLTVTAFHPVADPVDHFVAQVTIELNGRKIVSQTFRRQFDGATQNAVYRIYGLKSGDKVVVAAQCNITGKKKGIYVVPEQ